LALLKAGLLEGVEEGQGGAGAGHDAVQGFQGKLRQPWGKGPAEKGYPEKPQGEGQHLVVQVPHLFPPGGEEGLGLGLHGRAVLPHRLGKEGVFEGLAGLLPALAPVGEEAPAGEAGEGPVLEGGLGEPFCQKDPLHAFGVKDQGQGEARQGQEEAGVGPAPLQEDGEGVLLEALQVGQGLLEV
jgi:hypothetical protein